MTEPVPPARPELVQRLRSWATRACTLEGASLGFVFLPWALFLLGWVRLPYALPLVLLLAYGAQLALTEWTAPAADDGAARPSGEVDAPGRPLRHALLVLAILVLVGLSPLGYGAKNYDYPKHAALLRDLSECSYPLAYARTGTTDEPGRLVTYFAYYLPAGVVGRVLGWSAACHALYLWTVLGVYLVVRWAQRLLNDDSLLTLALLLGFGGLDILGWNVLHGWLHDGTGRLENWSYNYAMDPSRPGRALMGGVLWLYLDNVSFLYWGPHHVLPGLLLTFMAARCAVTGRGLGSLGLIACAAPFGSVFVAIGLLPLLAVCLLMNPPRAALTVQNCVVAPPLLLVSAAFLTSNNADFPHGWLWEFQDLLRTWPTLLLFYVVEFGLLAFLCREVAAGADGPAWRALFLAALATLLLAPWYRLGTYGDFTTKVALPSLNVLLLCYLRVARRKPAALLPLLLLGCMAALTQVGRGVAEPGPLLRPPPPRASISRLNELEPKDVAAQLFSDGDAFFWRHLARPVTFTGPDDR